MGIDDVDRARSRSRAGARCALVAAFSVALVVCAPRTSAQFDDFIWELEGVIPGSFGASGWYSAEQMIVCAGFNDPPGHVVALVTTAPVSGHVTALAWLESYDGFCASSTPAYLVNGEVTTLPICQSVGSVAFDVEAGDSFGFGVSTVIPTLPGWVHWESFSFEPLPPSPWWKDLGEGLAGFAGVPVLTGKGQTIAGEDVTLTLTHGKPSGSATLVVGSSVLQVSFKGGVLVPAPEVLVPGLLLDVTGSLVLEREWPAGIPAGFELFLQYWIADAAAVQGYSASNGLSATAL